MGYEVDGHDVVIVGSGASGLVAAITAARRGLSPIIIEKAAEWGGSSSLSGGALWIPANHLMARDGEIDTIEEALGYVRDVVPDEGSVTSKTRQLAFLVNAPKMLQFLCDEGVGLIREPFQPDYFSNSPHSKVGRTIQPIVSDGKKLGKWLETQRRYPGDVYAIKLGEYAAVGRGYSGLTSRLTMLKVGLRHRLMQLAGKQPLGLGSALAAELMLAVLRHKVPVVLGCRMSGVAFENGRAIGIDAEYSGKATRIAAPAGVLLCAGGFAHAEHYRRGYQNVDGSWSSASKDDTGDAVKLAESLGADTAMLDEAWWGCAVLYPDGTPGFLMTERTMPGSIIVDAQGRRFTNEAQNYNSLGRELHRRMGDPAWLIIDSRHRRKYCFGLMLPGQTPQALFDSGFFVKANSIHELANRCGIEAAGLALTVAKFNAAARRGLDEDFRRGENAYENYWGDPTIKPNPNLGPLQEPPFLATRVYPGDIGTKGGFVTDEFARVTRAGVPIDGLYAAGNCTASIFGRSYPGAGATLGPATTFAFLAMEHAAQRRAPHSADGVAL
jgi:3-oxosteroid 1-dehydrogenase